MKEQLALLRELQRIDLDLDGYKTQKEAIQGRLSESANVLERLSADLENQRASLEEIQGLERSKGLDLKEINENLKERKKRQLNVGSTKEYNAVEKEIEILQKSTEQTEEELLHLSEVIEETEASIESKTSKVKSLKREINKKKKEARSELTGLDEQIESLLARAQQARTDVSKRVIHKYDFIRKRRPGFAIVAVKEGHCEGCFMALPPQLYIQVQRGETLETCPSCQRIMFFWQEGEAQVSA